jgi:hypothetical protein
MKLQQAGRSMTSEILMRDLFHLRSKEIAEIIIFI